MFSQMILESTDPAVDAGAVDSAGLTVLHRVSQALDLQYLALLLEERQKCQGKRATRILFKHSVPSQLLSHAYLY